MFEWLLRLLKLHSLKSRLLKEKRQREVLENNRRIQIINVNIKQQEDDRKKLFVVNDVFVKAESHGASTDWQERANDLRHKVIEGRKRLLLKKKSFTK